MSQIAVDLGADILPAINNQLVSATGLAANYVFALDDENDEPAVKKNVLLCTYTPTTFVPDVGQQVGGAAYGLDVTLVLRGIIVVNFWSAFMVDQVGQNVAWFTDQGRGVWPFVMRGFTSLEQFNPLDNSNNVMLEQPMRMSPGDLAFISGQQSKMRRVRAEFEVSFLQKIYPIITSISPNVGPAAGGTSVVIKGIGLSKVTAVTFGSTPAASFSVTNSPPAPATITATTPAVAAGPVDVTVTYTTIFGQSITSQAQTVNQASGKAAGTTDTFTFQ